MSRPSHKTDANGQPVKRKRHGPRVPNAQAVIAAAAPAEEAAAATGRLLGEYLTCEELAAELGVTVLTIRRWEALRTGPPITRIGRKVLYRRQAVRAWLLKQESAA